MNEVDHDAILNNVSKDIRAGGHTGLSILADFLEDHNLPGAHIAREAGGRPLWRTEGEEIENHRFSPGNPFLVTPASGESLHAADSMRGTGPRLVLEFVRRLSPHTEPVTPAYLTVRHLGGSHPSPAASANPHPFYRVPVRSKAHLARLTADLPHVAASDLMRAGDMLPDHDPVDHERLSRKASAYPRVQKAAS